MPPALSSRVRQAARSAPPLLIGLYLMMLVPAEAGGGTPVALVALGVLAGAVQGAALWWRRSDPVPVTAVCLAGGLVTQLLAPDGIFPWAGLVVLGSLTVSRPPRVSLPALGGLLALTSLNFRTAPPDEAQFAMAVPVVVWALAEAVRNRRAAIEQAARRAVSEEQTRIARELHDVIAHSVSVIVVQAAAADDVFDQRPDQARASLRSIESAGRAALAELRRLLTAVRPTEGGGPGDRHPQPRLDGLEELAEPLRAAGLPVTLSVHVPGPLPAGIEVSAYRIVQEALTNVLRHARAHGVSVSVRAASGMLELDVLDDGAGPGKRAGSGGSEGGFGITGMRERAAALGGTLEATSGPDGRGFRVRARLPLPTDALEPERKRTR